MKLLSAILLLMLAPLALQAQEQLGGTTYVLAFPDTTMNTVDQRFPNVRHPDKAYLYIYSAVVNQVRIAGAGYSRTVDLPGGKFTIVDLMEPAAPAPIVTLSNRVDTATFRLEADLPIVVHCYLLTRFGTEAWTPLPVEAWGREYSVAARPGEIANDISQGGEFDYNKKSKAAPAQITIIAAFDNTYITIQPNGRLEDPPRIIDVLLQAGEVYQVQSWVDTSVYADLQPDLGGSRISATKPIGVISGNTRAQVLYFQEGLGQNIFKNMLVEWLRPVEMHGTEFVYMPTLDTRQPTGQPGEDLSLKRKGEHVRIYATSPGATTGFSLDNNIGRTDFTIAERGRFREDFIGTPEARYYKTDRPAQAMMNSTAIVKYNGTTQGFGGYIGAQFDGWGAYMVEMTPRNQWQSFAPIYTPAQPTGMQHFINVVVDSARQNDIYLKSGARFNFNRGIIRGSGLVWGTMALPAGEDNYLEGRNGARFSGFVYGLSKGHEEYRPGEPRKRESGEIQSGGGDDPKTLHPSEYEEYLAVSYGYPFHSAVLPLVPGPADSMLIDSTRVCRGILISARIVNANPSGVGTITLDSAVNTRIIQISRTGSVVTTAATVIVHRVIDEQPGSGVLVISDRTGKQRRVRFVLRGENEKAMIRSRDGSDELLVDPDSAVVREVAVSNPLSRPLRIDSIRMARGDQGFSIRSINRGPLPVDLAPGDSLIVSIQAKPAGGMRTFIDTVSVFTACTIASLPLKIRTTGPIMALRDLDFGSFFRENVTSTQMMRVCNDGSGNLTFSDGPGGELLVWINRQLFTVDTADLRRLRNARIGSGLCFDLPVTFRSTVEGVFRDSARVFANDRERKSYSIWKASVRFLSGVASETGGERSVVIRPHPASGTTAIDFRLDAPGVARLVIVDNEGRRVETIEQMFDAGDRSIRWDASSLPAGIYFYRLVTDAKIYSGSIVVVR